MMGFHIPPIPASLSEGSGIGWGCVFAGGSLTLFAGCCATFAILLASFSVLAEAANAYKGVRLHKNTSDRILYYLHTYAFYDPSILIVKFDSHFLLEPHYSRCHLYPQQAVKRDEQHTRIIDVSKHSNIAIPKNSLQYAPRI